MSQQDTAAGLLAEAVQALTVCRAYATLRDRIINHLRNYHERQETPPLEPEAAQGG